MTDTNYHDMDDHTILVMTAQKLDRLNGTVALHITSIAQIESKQEQNFEDIASLWSKFDNCIHLTFRQYMISFIIVAIIAVGGTMSAVEYL